MKRIIIILSLILIILGCKSTNSSTTVREDLLPLNPEILTGNLDNGVSYYIKENEKPENRIELRLVVRAGSMQESEKQLGLAHFVEHMAFNGTKNFEKDSLVKYLDSVGMAFGPEINAYTSFDETVYKLSIPADDEEVIDTAFQILEDWAHQISFEDEEIEKERGVIIEEWRLGRGVQGRYRDILIPELLDESRYANRLPIGDVEIIEHCDPQELRDYYNSWYRPELMSVVVVGSISSEEIINKIERHFSFTHSHPAKDAVDNSVPIIERTAVKVIPDPENTQTKISYFLKRKGIPIRDRSSYRNLINEYISIMMFNSRMEEIYTKPETPFIHAGGGLSSFVDPIDLTSFSVKVTEGRSVEGFQALLEEIERVKQFGYVEEEFLRGKKLVQMILESQYNERANTTNSSISSEIVDYVVGGGVPMGISHEYKIAMEILDKLTLEEINRRAVRNYSSRDRVVTVQMPESNEYPLESDFSELFSLVESLTYTPREESSLNLDFFDLNLESGSVSEKRDFSISGITELTLSNGIRVLLKPTDFKEDEILLSATSFGGLSLVDDRRYRSGELTGDLISASGVNGYDLNDLNKVLTGRNLNLEPWIGYKGEGFSGSSSVKDLEGMLQLLHLYVVKPEFSSEVYQVLMQNTLNHLKNRGNSPDVVFYDRIIELIGGGHFRNTPLTIDELTGISMEDMVDIYRERFQDMNDFTFIFTGTFTVEEITPLLEKYIATLPATEGSETTRDLGIRPVPGSVKEVIKKGIEEKSQVRGIFNGEFSGEIEDVLALDLMVNYLEEQLRVSLREDMGGTYGVGMASSIRLYPNRWYYLQFGFGCEPGREDELVAEAQKIFNSLKEGEYDQEAIDAVKVNHERSLELQLKDNSYWSSIMTYVVQNGLDLEKITDVDLSYITGEKFSELAKTYLDSSNFIQVILQPE